MEELFVEIEKVVRIKGEADWYEHFKHGKGTRIKSSIKSARAYILSSLEDHAKELGITTRKRRNRNKLEDPFTALEE